jgi:hypothetical protein
VVDHRKTGQSIPDLPRKINIATKVSVREAAYPTTSSECKRERSQPTATDQEETSTHIAARCKVDTFLTAAFIAEYFRED